MAPPNPKCYICAPQPQVTLCIDTKQATIKYLRDEVMVKALNMVDPDVMIDGTGIIVISCDVEETECNNDKLMKDMSIVDGCVLKVDDFFQNYKLTIIIVHKDKERNDAALFEVIADADALKEAQSADIFEAAKRAKIAETADEAGPSTSAASTEQHQNGNGESANKMNVDDDDDDICVVVEEAPPANNEEPSSSSAAAATGAKKRKTAGDEPLAKRSKTINNDDLDDDIICIDDN